MSQHTNISAKANTSIVAAEQEVDFYRKLSDQIPLNAFLNGYNLLQTLKPLNSNNVMESCINELHRFINQNRQIGDKTVNTAPKVIITSAYKERDFALKIQIQFKKMTNLKKLNKLLQSLPQNLTTELSAVFGRCQLIINNYEIQSRLMNDYHYSADE